ncbi:hypothetical protein BurJ1DRAFT_4591 [Burkholderiales bacterium JOSHI_001]|nr:hypothetical protein BurJ1DRAFT_4591 [Burkholderiales bacterium JOSHI_001]
MSTTRLFAALSLAALASVAGAQTLNTEMQRDINQETRIRDGLQSGQLNTREAAVLQREQAHVDQLQARSLKDGRLTKAERARIDHAQDQASRDIARARHNGVSGNPTSASSQRMQQAVQRDINQEKRIQQGVQSGELSNREVSQLERGQARDGRQQFRTGRDDQVSAAENHATNRAQNRQSARIYNKKHNAVERKV